MVRARAIRGSGLLVVSAGGQVLNFTLTYIVADIRDGPPSAWAVCLTQDWLDSRAFVVSAGRRLALLARRRLARSRNGLEGWVRRWGRLHPRRRLEVRSQRVDDATESLRRAVVRAFRTVGRLCLKHF